jgi:hypothetical protein
MVLNNAGFNQKKVKARKNKKRNILQMVSFFLLSYHEHCRERPVHPTSPRGIRNHLHHHKASRTLLHSTRLLLV